MAKEKFPAIKAKMRQPRRQAVETSRPPISLQISNNRHYKSGSHPSSEYKRSVVIFMDKNTNDVRLIDLLKNLPNRFTKEQRNKSILLNNLSDSEAYIFILYYNELNFESEIKGLLYKQGQKRVQSILSGKPTSIW